MEKHMLKTFLRCLWVLLLCPMLAFANEKSVAPFQAGTDYQVLPVASDMPASKNKVSVVEFFSFGCPACFHFEPTLEAWLAKQPADVSFDRVPVVFESGWDVLARGYYTAKNLGEAKKLAPAIFKAQHVQGLDLSDPKILKQFFVAHGVSAKDFDSTYQFSPGIDAQLMRGDNLMRYYHIAQIPTLVINGKYITSPAMAGSIPRLLQVADYLIAQERAGINKK
jgi:thiol:disulfide interchange protein DsbA